MGKQLGLVSCVVLAACQPMYGGRPEPLRAVPRSGVVRHFDEVVKIDYVEECNYDFRGNPKGVKRQTAAANTAIVTGDAASGSVDKTQAATAKYDLIVASIGKYSEALRKDPYSAEATLKLAIAYDHMLRKGCALALLKRLGTLAENPKFSSEANPRIDAVADSRSWFKDYRKDAMTAIGR
jgi:hypothetical protein